MRRFLAFVLYLALGLPLALSSLALLASRPWALDREAYKRFVLDDRLYAALQAPELARGAPPTISLDGTELDGPSLVAAAQKELPVPELKSTAAGAVDAVLDGVMGPGLGGKAPSVDLGRLKAALASRKGALARDYEAGLASRSGSGRPTEAEAAQASGRAIGRAIDAIPGKLSLPAPRVAGPRGLPLGLLTRGSALTQAALDRLALVTSAFSALFIAGLAAMGGTGLLDSVSRAGRFLLFPSVLVLAAGIALALPGGILLQAILPHGIAGLLGGAAGARLHELFLATLGPIARDIFITGLAGTSLGAVLARARRIELPAVEGERRRGEIE